MSSGNRRLYTVGHSTHNAKAFIDLLARHGIALLVDVRSLPGSRRNPQFNRETLQQSLAAADITYHHAGDLGGRRKGNQNSINDGWENASFRAYADHMQTGAFARALDRLLIEAGKRATAIMCAEALPWRCHRWLIADAAAARGWQAVHIMGAGKDQAHRMTSFAQVEDGEITYPFALDGG